MPFDMAPQETKVGTFQNCADLMLAGCALSKPITCHFRKEGDDGEMYACAIGAMTLALKAVGSKEARPDNWFQCTAAYVARYGEHPMSDNDRGLFTREQIAARIAAL